MKRKFALLATLLVSVIVCQAQLDSDFELEFASKDDYRKHEEKVAQIADYLLSIPLNDASPKTKAASASLVKWMTGTPDYHFELDGTLTAFTKDNETLLVPILASMTSYVLKNKEKADNMREVKRNGYTIFLDYCQNRADIKLTRELKKALAAKEKGELNKYLKI